MKFRSSGKLPRHGVKPECLVEFLLLNTGDKQYLKLDGLGSFFFICKQKYVIYIIYICV